MRVGALNIEGEILYFKREATVLMKSDYAVVVYEYTNVIIMADGKIVCMV